MMMIMMTVRGTELNFVNGGTELNFVNAYNVGNSRKNCGTFA